MELQVLEDMVQICDSDITTVRCNSEIDKLRRRNCVLQALGGLLNDG